MAETLSALAAVARAASPSVRWTAVIAASLALLGGAAAPPEGALPLAFRDRSIYYLPSELDRRPRLHTRVEPEYPRAAPPEGGYVLLRLLISEQGTVERAVVIAASPEGVFEDAAVEAFSRGQFSPGMLRGVPVKSQVMIEARFHPITPEYGAVASGGH